MTARLEAALAELADAIREEIREELRTARGGPERLLSVGEAAELSSLGRTALYQAIGNGRIRSVVVGRRRLIPASAIAELAATSQQQEAARARDLRPGGRLEVTDVRGQPRSAA